MPKNIPIQFEKRYHAALRRHLRQWPGGRSSSRTARSLGRAALSCELDTLDLARVHDRAMAALITSAPDSTDREQAMAAQAGGFFLEALAPIEQTHPAAQTAAAQAKQLESELRERRSLLMAVRRQLRSESARREGLEKRLLRGAEHYSQLLVQSRRMQAQSRRVAHRILSAQEEERKEISRELHDEVAQILAGINVQLAALKEAAAVNSRSLRQRIAQTQRLVSQSVLMVHRYARALRPAMLDDLGLIPALRSYIKDLPGRKGLTIRFKAFAGVEALSNMRRTVLYRVTQEALTNVSRHACARLVTVRIYQVTDAVRLEVHDDGKSFLVDRVLTSNTHKRLGLIGMRERVEMVGGDFSIASAPGKGTTVRAEIPFHSKH